MNLRQCYDLLGVNERSSNEDISKSFKRLAHQYHPDKNRDRIEWANRAMSDLNYAYSMIMSVRFQTGQEAPRKEQPKQSAKQAPPRERKEPPRQKSAPRGDGGDYRDSINEQIRRDILINEFVTHRESAKDSLYRYFQFSLFNIARRESVSNRSIFNELVHSLRTSFHTIQKLKEKTADPELLEHFTVFCDMIFGFYKASECLNILDSYSNIVDVDAFRLYRKGDEALHQSHREIFFDRHNRGYFKKDLAQTCLLHAEKYFRDTINSYPRSSWAVETRIKLEYTLALKRYMHLFFSDS